MCWCFIDYWLKNARWNIEKRISSCLHRLWRWNRQSVPKRRHIHFSRRGITQKKEYNIQYTANVWNQECTRYMPACILLESGFIWAETCSCHWALNNEQLVADGSLLASFIFVIVSIWTLLPCKIHRVSDGELLHFLYYFWGAAVQVLCITVTRICDLHLVFGSGPGWLRLYCSWLSIRRAEAQKKGAKTSPCPLIHPALQATALSIGWSARDRWLTCRRGSLHRSIDSFGGAWLQGYCDALVYGSGTRIPPHSPPSHNWDTIIWWGQHVWSLLISVGGLCYQTPCHSCFRLATLLIFVTPAQDIAPAL